MKLIMISCRRYILHVKMCMFDLFRSPYPRHWTLRKYIIFSALIIGVIILFLSYKMLLTNYLEYRPIAHHLKAMEPCRFDMPNHKTFKPQNHYSRDSMHISKRVLIIAESPYSKLSKNIVTLLDYARMDYKFEITERLPPMTHFDKAKFGVIIFEKMDTYTKLSSWNRQLVDKYCRDYKVGQIIFAHSVDEIGIEKEKVSKFPLVMRYNMALQDYSLNIFSDMWRITRPGEILEGPVPGDDWVVFEFNHSTYESLAHAKGAPPPFLDSDRDPLENQTVVSVLLDRGTLDNIRRVYFGNGLQFWLHQLIMLDALSYLSHGKLSLPLDRYIQIDIDDIFVGAKGTRTTAEDVEVIVNIIQLHDFIYGTTVMSICVFSGDDC